MVSSFKDLGDLLEEKIKNVHYLESNRNVQGPTEKGFTVETITNLLNMEGGLTKQLEGNLLIGMTGFSRFFTFDNQTIQKVPTYLKKLTETLKNGRAINYQKLYNEYSVTIGLPTATGLPLVYTLNTPTLLGAKGMFSANVPTTKQTKDGVFVLPDYVNTTTQMHITYTTRTQSKITFITPFNQKRYVAGYDKNTQFEVPIKKQFNLDLKNHHVKVEVAPVKENTDTKLFHYSTWPYVAVDNIVEFKPLAESSIIHRVQSHPLQKFQHMLGDKEIGVVFRLEGQSDKNYVDLSKFYQKFLKHGFVPTLLASTSTENIEHTTLDLYYDGQKSTAKKVILTGSYQYSPVETTTTTTTEGSIRTTENGAVTGTKTVDSQVRKNELLQKVKQGIKSSSAVVVDLGIQVEGQTKTEFLATVAVSTSPVDGQTRVLGYGRKNVNSKNFEVCLDVASVIPKVSVVDFTKILETDLKGDIYGKLLFGEQCQTGSKVSVVGELKRTQERKEYLEGQPIVKQAKIEKSSGYNLQPSQTHASKEAGIFDDYTFVVKYENVPETVKNITYKTYKALQYFGYPFLTENVVGQTNLQEGQVELGVNFTPDLKALNLYIYSPLGDSRFSNVHLNPLVTKGLTIHPMYTTIERIANVAFNEKYQGTY